MRIVFAGSPSLALPALEKTAGSGEVCAVLTGTDQPSGRGRNREPTPVKVLAARLGLEIIEAEKIDAAVENRVRELSPDLLVVVAFGRIFRQSFLDLFPRGGINMHPSLLPRHRVILLLKEWQGFSVAEIARVMGWKVRKVHNELYQVRNTRQGFQKGFDG